MRTNIVVLCTFFKCHAAPLLLLFILTGLTFSEVLNHNFLINWDDQAYITKNPAIRGFTFDHIRTAFSSYYVGNYAPVQIVSYMLDYTLWGGNPFGYLLANILYHFFSGVLLYFLLLRVGCRLWSALLGAAVFIVHPVQVESVAWLSQRKNLLAMLMYLAAFHAYLSYRKSDVTGLRWYVVSVTFFLLALLSKSVAVIFPVVLVMYDVMIPSVRRSFREHVDKLPYFAAAAVFGALAMLSQSDSYSGGGRVAYPVDAFLTIPFSMLPVLVKYLQLIVWPVPSSMSILYFPPLRTHIDGAVLSAFIVAIVLATVGWYLCRKDRSVLFWYASFFVGLLPVSQIIPLVTMMNDRYLYFPMLGIAGLVAYGADRLWNLSGVATRWRMVLPVLALSVVVVLSVVSHMRGRVWMDTLTLFGDGIAKYPNEVSTLSGMAEGYVASGDLKKGQELYETARLFGKLDEDAVYNLAHIYFEANNPAAAYNLIIEMKSWPDKYSKKPLLLGEYFYRSGNYPAAEEALLAYLAQVPDSVHGLYLLGQTYMMTGYNEQAAVLYAKAVAAGGDHPGLFFAIACVESLQGHTEKSLAALQSALKRGISTRDLKEGELFFKNISNDRRYQQLVRGYSGG